MNFSSSLKKIICLLLAAFMLFSTVGCKQETSKKKKKVIVKKQVIVKNDEDDSNNQNDVQVETPEDTDTEVEKGLPARPLPSVATEEEGYVEWVEPIVPEFEYEYADLSIDDSYVIIYALETWENRKESATKIGENADGTAILADRYISTTGLARLSANDLKTYFKDEYNLNLQVVKDTDYEEGIGTTFTGNENKIIVGYTKYNPEEFSTLGENEFSVRVSGKDLIFEADHIALITKSVKWYETVEIKEGKVATLSGTTEDFKSQVTLNGVTYDWVWGDEFDGAELINSDNWKQTEFGNERGDDFRGDIFEDSYFHYVENGRLRMTADRYYNEIDVTKGYASSGDTNTEGKMQYRNGYVEVRARLPYRRGAFPAIWTMSNPDNKDLPNYYYNDGYGQYNKVYWTIEFDLFETFADSDHASTTLHKWYSSAAVGATKTSQDSSVYTELTTEQIKELNQRAYDNGYYVWMNETYKSQYGFTDEFVEEVCVKVVRNGETRYAFDSGILTKDITDSDGNVTGKKYIYYPIELMRDDGTSIDIFEYRLRPFTNMNQNGNTYAYSFTYDSSSNKTGGLNKEGIYNWKYYFNPDTINQEYHVYSFHITSDHCTVYMDGEAYLDFDWDPAYDYRDVNGDGVIEDISLNNNGVGYNLWHFLMFDMMIYTPGNYKIDEDRKLQKGDYPFNLYVDWIRCYQDLDDNSQALWYPNGAGD